MPTVEHFMKLGGWFAGTPDELVAFLKDFEERYPGLEHINLSMPMGTPQAIMLDQYRRVDGRGDAALRALNAPHRMRLLDVLLLRRACRLAGPGTIRSRCR